MSDESATEGAAATEQGLGAGGEPEPDEAFSWIRAFGGWGAVLDAAFPGVAFVITYTTMGRNLRLALIVALAIGALFAVIRIWRKDPLQNVVGGLFGVAIAALIANASGEARDFFLPGLFINAGYAVIWAVANIAKWPLIGVLIGTAAGWGFEWRKDPALVRAFALAGWIWVATFVVRLAVQVPMYLDDEIGRLAVARLVMGWPLWVVTVLLSAVVIKRTVPKSSLAAVTRAARQLAERGSVASRRP